MLLLDDDDELPESPHEEEVALAAQFGAQGLAMIDQTLVRFTRASWLKSARVVADAVQAGGFAVLDDAYVDLHVRRLIDLVRTGQLEAQGDLRKPRFSEVRLPGNVAV